MTSYKSIAETAKTELIIKHSRFIATAHPIKKNSFENIKEGKENEKKGNGSRL